MSMCMFLCVCDAGSVDMHLSCKNCIIFKGERVHKV